MDEKQERTAVRARLRRRRRLRKGLRLLLALAVAVGLCALAVNIAGPAFTDDQADGEAQAASYAAAVAERGTLVKTVYGSGTVQPASQPSVYATGDAVVAERLVGLGDEVKAGDVIMRLANSELEEQIAELEYALWEAQTEVEATETYDQYRYEVKIDPDTGRRMVDAPTGKYIYEQYSNELSIRAPSAGRVMAVYIQPGDDALAVYREKGSVILLSTDGRMKVEFDVAQGAALTLGQTVNVRGTGVRTTGTVVSLTRRGTEAIVQIESDEYPLGTAVTLTDASGATIGEGALAINKPMAVSAYGGTIRGVMVSVGDTVEREAVLARFSWDDMPLYIDNASVLLTYAKAQVELEAALAQREGLVITAPCDGKIASIDAAIGDEVSAGTALLSIVEDTGMTLVLSVDELDILAVEPGQAVKITLDALEGVTITGSVKKIAPLGNVGTGVTTYDVYIDLDETDAAVLGGMNASGEIAVQEVQDALLIPTDALGKNDSGYCVTLSDGTVRTVSVGLMTRDQVQILSGISEGETVIY